MQQQQKKNEKETRRYGYFKCLKCKKIWESSHVYCEPDTYIALYKQDCKMCKTSDYPYRVDALRCSECGEEKCICESSSSSSEEEKEEDDELTGAMASLDISSEKEKKKKKKRHINENKPHLSRYCERCRTTGRRCGRD